MSKRYGFIYVDLDDEGNGTKTVMKNRLIGTNKLLKLMDKLRLVIVIKQNKISVVGCCFCSRRLLIFSLDQKSKVILAQALCQFFKIVHNTL